MARSLNKVMLIGNLTKDPELKYTPQGTAVANFTIATNRTWKDYGGNQQDEATFHRCVAWSKLAEICGQYLFKGKRIYIAGRLSNRSWDDKQGVKHYITEVVVDDMIMLDGNRGGNNSTVEAAEEVFGEGNYPPEPEK